MAPSHDQPSGLPVRQTLYEAFARPEAVSGSTTKPRCPACDHAPPPAPQRPSCPPPLRRSPRGWRRQVAAPQHYCPTPECDYYGWAGRGNLRANGHPSGGPWRQRHCIVCGGYFLETYGTLFHGKHIPPERLVWAAAALAEGLGIRIERVNLTTRQNVAGVRWRVMTLCKGEEGLRQQLALHQAYYNICLPHASLRLPLPQPEPTNGNGSAKRWQPQTPGMAAGLTDHVWTLGEVLRYRVPPWPQLQAL